MPVLANLYSFMIDMHTYIEFSYNFDIFIGQTVSWALDILCEDEAVCPIKI